MLPHVANAQLAKKIVSGDKALADTCSNEYLNKYQTENALKLDHLLQSTESSHLRLHLIGDNMEYIDVWTNDYKKYSATLTFYIDGWREENKASAKANPVTDYVYNQDTLSPDTAELIYSLLANLKSIPSSYSIKDWRHGPHGALTFLEETTLTDYVDKSWSFPEMQYPDLKEAVIINNVLNSVMGNLDILRKWQWFINSLPLGEFYTENNGYLSTVYLRKRISKLRYLWWKLHHRKLISSLHTPSPSTTQ